MDTSYCDNCGLLHDPDDGDCEGCKMSKQITLLTKQVKLWVEVRENIEGVTRYYVDTYANEDWEIGDDGKPIDPEFYICQSLLEISETLAKIKEMQKVSEKKWSNALNKPWYSLDEDGDFSTMANDILPIEKVLEHLNGSTEKAVINANKIESQAATIESAREVINNCYTNFKCDHFVKSYMSYIGKDEKPITTGTGLAAKIHNREHFQRLKRTVIAMEQWLKDNEENNGN